MPHTQMTWHMIMVYHVIWRTKSYHHNKLIDTSTVKNSTYYTGMSLSGPTFALIENKVMRAILSGPTSALLDRSQWEMVFTLCIIIGYVSSSGLMLPKA